MSQFMACSNEKMENFRHECGIADWGVPANAHDLENILTCVPECASTVVQVGDQSYAFSSAPLRVMSWESRTQTHQPQNGIAWYDIAANDNISIQQQLGYDNSLAWRLDGNTIPSDGPNLPMPLAAIPTTFLDQPLYPVVGPFPDGFQNVVPVTAEFNTNAFPAILPGAPALAPANLAPDVQQYLGAGATFRQRAPEPRISCEFPGCTKTFRRPGDFRRHMRKHQPANLKCIVDDCDMKFYRLDKLRDHIRQGHKIVL
ncbi:transcription factor c2h2 [Stemphylium lycopersici]|uniref:Transcription factor c2h2 n=1 Tax=Stemphylium lycopersici TaxID=183478 RepID=A0A364N250_STELY|nr:transcription factor c2h2 [Stemphylium lycopersici]